MTFGRELADIQNGLAGSGEGEGLEIVARLGRIQEECPRVRGNLRRREKKCSKRQRRVNNKTIGKRKDDDTPDSGGGNIPDTPPHSQNDSWVAVFTLFLLKLRSRICLAWMRPWPTIPEYRLQYFLSHRCFPTPHQHHYHRD